MKRSIVKYLASIIMVVGGFVFAASAANAAEKEDAKVSIPATSAAIWQAIDGHVHDLYTLLGKGDLKDVHVHAFAIRDLVRGLPTRSQNLSPETLTKVKDQSKFVDALAERLDKTGDANDKPGTEGNLTKLEGILKTIRAQY